MTSDWCPLVKCVNGRYFRGLLKLGVPADQDQDQGYKKSPGGNSSSDFWSNM